MRYLIALSAAALAAQASASPYDAPTNYYDSATGSGATLKNQLHNIIDNHTVLSYNQARSSLQVTDRDPNDADNIILVYNRVSLDVSGLINGSGIPGWDGGASWNREHVWPRSRGIDSSGADNSDLHNLRPSNPQVNEDRLNFNFGGAFGQSFGLTSDGGTVWYPGDADAGMVARQAFYVDTRYDGSDSQTNNVQLTVGNPGAFGTTMGNLDRLIEWHYAAPPTDFELRRNDVIYDSYQGNRNPFIDRPEYAWSVFVDQNNDSRITITGGAASADPSETTTMIDFGTVIVGADPGALEQQVTLNKAGNDGAYYAVNVSGDASSPQAGRYNAFNTSGTDSAIITVGMAGDTAAAGMKTGGVTIDNLDVTTNGGAGRGANDADDVITTRLTVLDHSNGSFSGSADQDTLTIDFGQVAQGSSPDAISFDLFNLESTADYTSDLVIGLTLFSSGSPLLQVSGLSGAVAPGGSAQGQAQFVTASVGSFASTWTVNVRDDFLPGATAQQLTVHLTGEVIAALLGDFNNDQAIDPADYDLLIANLGGPLDPYDLTGDGQVDGADLSEWVNALSGTGFGDLDFDGDVDDADYGLAFAGFTGPGGGPVQPLPWAQGDLDLDGDVDDADYGLAFAAFTGPGAPANVPEPASVLLLLALGAITGKRARRM